MTTETTVVLPETFNWLTQVVRRYPNSKKTGFVLELSTKFPQSIRETYIYINSDQLIYTDTDGKQMQVQHTRIVPTQDGGEHVETYTDNLIQDNDLVYVELSRGNLKGEKDGVPQNGNYCSNYWWNLESISPGEGIPLVQASLNTPRQQVSHPRSADDAAPAGQNPAFEVRGDIKGHCEKIIAMLAVAKLLPGIEAEDGGIDWDTFRSYRDLYYHNVSNIPVVPLALEEAAGDEEANNG
jgi:hypothetical protein